MKTATRKIADLTNITEGRCLVTVVCTDSEYVHQGVMFNSDGTEMSNMTRAHRMLEGIYGRGMDINKLSYNAR